MMSHQFHSMYANLPLNERVLSIPEFNGRSLQTVYQEIKRLEDLIRPTQVEIDVWLRKVENYWIKTGKI
jgi:hypothetical protein